MTMNRRGLFKVLAGAVAACGFSVCWPLQQGGELRAGKYKYVVTFFPGAGETQANMGQIADLRITNVRLSDAEITRMYMSARP